MGISKKSPLLDGQAVQTFDFEKNLVRRTAMCMQHQRQTSRFLYPDERGWWFSCPEGHKFVAKPDPHAPRTEPEIREWMKMQEASKLRTFQ